MTPIIFTKSYINLNLLFSLLSVAIGALSAIFFDDISPDFQDKVKIVIFLNAFVFIYMLIKIKKLIYAPAHLIINVEKKIVIISPNIEYKFSDIANLYTTEKKFDYMLSLTDLNGKVILQTNAYYDANTASNNIEQCFKEIQHFHILHDNT